MNYQNELKRINSLDKGEKYSYYFGFFIEREGNPEAKLFSEHLQVLAEKNIVYLYQRRIDESMYEYIAEGVA